MKSETQMSKSAIRFALLVGILACGCREPSRTPAASYQLQAGAPEFQAEQILAEGLIDPDPRIRSQAVETVAATRSVGLASRVQKLIGDSVVPVRFSAAVALGDLQYKPAEKDVSSLLDDPDASVKIAAAYAMMKLGHPEYSKVFRDAITSDDQTLRANAALLLGKSGNQAALRLLYWTLQRRDSDEKVILQAAESIAMLGDERIYPKLWTQLISAYADDRVVGIRAMGLLGTEQAKNAIVTMLDDPVLEVRLAAAEQLGELGDTIGQDEAQRVFDKDLLEGMDAQSQERVKIMTALAIGEIATEPLLKHLPSLLADSSKTVRIAAAKAVLCARTKHK
jgi:HEAT repeat protein